MQPASQLPIPQVVPGQDILLHQLGIAGVFLVTVLIAVAVLWKHGNARAEAQDKARRDADDAAAEERARILAEHSATIAKLTADAFKAIEQSRAEFLSESRRRDDKMDSQIQRFDDKLDKVTRDNNATVQAMHAKTEERTAQVVVLVEALTKRLTI